MLLKLEEVLSVVQPKRAHVGLSAMTEGDVVCCHAWTPSGHLLLGTAGGKLLLAHGAAPPGGPTATTWGQRPPIIAELHLADELRAWSAGGILGLYLTGAHLIVVFECPDGTGGLVVWLSPDSPTLAAHVDLPNARTAVTACSPARQQLLVADANARCILLTTHGDDTDYLQVCHGNESMLQAA